MTVRDKEYEFLPRYLCGATPPWVGHMKFAASLVREFQPRLFVELGTHYGNSYFAFCQAVKLCKLSCKCFAVDHWKGEAQAGSYSNSVFETVSARNESCYKDFSQLLRMDFDEAVKKFADESIDILHIDGFHSYEAVSHDFKTWEKKVKKGGIILFHDIAVRQEGYGVWKFWEELKKRSAETFSFLHSNGLGVWRKKGGGELKSPILRELLTGKDRLSPEMAELLSYWIDPPEYRRNTLKTDGVTSLYFTPAELYYAGEKGDFAPDKKLDAETASLRENTGILLQFSLENIPEGQTVFRLDLGLTGELYSIKEFVFVNEKEMQIPILNTFSPEKSCNIISVPGEDGSLEFLALNDDPNLLFTPPPGKYKQAILKVLRNPDGGFEKLRKEYAALQSSGTQLRQEKEMWQNSSKAFENDRDAWKSVAEEKRKENEDLRNTLNEITEELSGAETLLTEKENSITLREHWIAEKDAVIAEKESIISRRNEEISQKNNEIAKQQEIIAEKDSVIAGRDAVIAEREAELAGQRELISNQQAAILQKEEGIAKLHSVIAEKDSVIAGRDAVIAEREAELASQRELISNQQAGIVQRDEEIARRSNVIAERESIISRRNEELRERDETITNLNHIIAEKENTISLREEEIRARETDLASCRSTLSAREEVLLQKEEEISRQNGIIAGKDAVISRKEEEIRDKNTVIAQREETISRKDLLIREKEEEIIRQENTVALRDSAIEERDSAIKVKEEELARGRDTISRQDAVLREDLEKLALRQKEIEELKALLLEREKTIGELEVRLIHHQTRAENSHLLLSLREKELKELKGSLLWRGTAPFRKLAGITRKK